MNQLVRQFFVYGLGATIGKFLAVLLLPIYASVFTPEDYGNLDLILTIGTILSTFGLLQIETGVQRYYYEVKTEEERNRLVKTSLSFVTLLSIIIICVSIIFLKAISNSYLNGCYSLELLIALFMILPLNATTILFIDFRYRNMTITYVILNLILVVLSAVCSIISVKFLNTGILGVVASSTGTYFLVWIISFFIWKKNTKDSLFNKSYLKDLLKFSLPQFPARLGSLSNSYINRFFMVGMLSVHAIGIYAIALRLASAMQLIQTAFTLAWLPYMYKLLTKPGHDKMIVSIYVNLSIFLSYIIVIFSLFSKEIVLFLTNENYQESALYVPILAYYFVLYTLKEVVDIGIKVSKKTKYTSYIFLFSTIVNIILLYYLTPFMQLYGVSVALLISNLVLFYVSFYVSKTLYPINFPLGWTILLNVVVLSAVFLPGLISLSFITRLFIAFIISLGLLAFYRKTLADHMCFFRHKC